MNHQTTVDVTTGTLDVPGAKLHYEVRGTGPCVLLVGAPMNADSFAPLADLLSVDHTVITTDPRGINRSTVHDRDQDSTIDLRADDLSRLLARVDAGPAAVLGSSGGAVSVLGLAQAHPEQVRTVIAHEPPLQELLDDRDQLRAASEDMIATYVSGDTVGAGRKFLAIANIELPEPVFQMIFGGERDAQQTADDDFQYTRMIRPTTQWIPDFDRLRAISTRVVVGIGEESGQQLCERTSIALAAGLGIEPTWFPGDHVGFAENPEAFATRLRAVLQGS